MSEKTDNINRALDHLENAKGIIDGIDAPTANVILEAKWATETLLAREARALSRAAWGVRPSHDS